MENFLILFLFTYPGAIVEWILSRTTATRTFYTKQDGIVATIRCFFFSACITFVSTFIFCVSIGQTINKYTLTQFLAALKDLQNLIRYSGIALGVSIPFAGLWYIGMLVVYSIVNWIREKRQLPTIGTYSAIWAGLVNDPKKIDTSNYIVKVVRGSETIACGFIDAISDDISDDSALVLKQCVVASDHVKTKVLEALYSYVDLKTGCTINFYDGTDLANKLRGSGKLPTT